MIYMVISLLQLHLLSEPFSGPDPTWSFVP